MIEFLENLYRICDELIHHETHLRTLLDNRDEFPNWDANVSFHFTNISNNIHHFKSRLIEFDNAMNGVTEFDRKVLQALRKKVRNLTSGDSNE